MTVKSRNIPHGIVGDWATRAAAQIVDDIAAPLSEGRRFSAISRVAAILDLKTKEVFALLRDSRCEHDHCEDTWFCCRACRSEDHLLRDGEHLDLRGRLDQHLNAGDCTCGASAWNARVDALLRRAGLSPLEPDDDDDDWRSS